MSNSLASVLVRHHLIPKESNEIDLELLYQMGISSNKFRYDHKVHPMNMQNEYKLLKGA